jgi:hypothetical protein
MDSINILPILSHGRGSRGKLFPDLLYSTLPPTYKIFLAFLWLLLFYFILLLFFFFLGLYLRSTAPLQSHKLYCPSTIFGYVSFH